MAKKIKLFPVPHVELRIHVSDEMVKDMHTCRKAMMEEMEGPDCKKCSWDDIEVFGTGMCEIREVIDSVMKMEEDHESINSR